VIHDSSVAISIILALVAAGLFAFGHREFRRSNFLVGEGQREARGQAVYAILLGLAVLAIEAYAFATARLVIVLAVALLFLMWLIYLNLIVKPRLREQEAAADETFVNAHRLDSP